MNRHVLVLASLSLASCASVNPLDVASPVAGIGEVASGVALAVRPVALLEDSRCPALVQCVWAGQVRISAEVTDDGGRAMRELTLGTTLTLNGGTVTLIAVEPARLASGNTDPASYRFTFHFAR